MYKIFRNSERFFPLSIRPCHPRGRNAAKRRCRKKGRLSLNLANRSVYFLELLFLFNVKCIKVTKAPFKVSRRLNFLCN